MVLQFEFEFESTISLDDLWMLMFQGSDLVSLSNFDWHIRESTAICESTQPTNCPVQLVIFSKLYLALQKVLKFICIYSQSMIIFSPFGTCHTHISWIYNIAIGWSLQSKEQETLLFLYTGLKRKTKTFHLRIQSPLKTVCSKFNMRC